MEWDLQNRVEKLLGKEGVEMDPVARELALAALVPELFEAAKKLTKELRPYRNFANMVGPEARLYSEGQWSRKVVNAAEQPVWSHCGAPKKLSDVLKVAVANALKPVDD